MTIEQLIEDQHQARMSLMNCAKYIHERDALIRHAAALRITHKEIARILGMNRSYITEIVNRK